MGTEVLRPQDCLIQRIRVAPAVRKSYGNGNGNPRSNNSSYRKQYARSDQRKKSPEPSISKRSSSSEDLRPRSNNLGQSNFGSVTILKRGEVIHSKNKTNEMVGNLSPVPDLKQIRVSPVTAGDTYAGSAFSLSPSPRALPLPSFFSKKQVAEFVDDSATRDLRRLLRLD
ncbi:hypothetical protein LguiA_001173 [Lonicera macranthoides]